jgi:lipopolysaccharide transport system ATP-binding protein
VRKMRPIISVRNVSKRYHVASVRGPRPRLSEAVVGALKSSVGSFRNYRAEETLWALKDVSFEAMPGEVIGIIGRNGAGKSTLLRILSRITKPSSGEIDIYGRLGTLLEIGTGFHPDLTGRENIFLNGTILGMKVRETRRKFDEIIAFAEVERFVDTPVKHYSSGMYLRLAFSVAAHFEPEVLLLDEIIAVGDLAFQKKCVDKMKDVSRQGRTVFFVSHNLAAIESLCSRVFVLKSGNLLEDDPNDAIANYLVDQNQVLSTGELL